MSRPRAIFFDAGNTLLFPRLDDLVRLLHDEKLGAEPEDFHSAERFGKNKLDAWLWPQIRAGQVPRAIDRYYWSEYLGALLHRVGAPQGERSRLAQRIAERFRDIQLWSQVFPETGPFLDSLRAQGYTLGVISNSVGTLEHQLRRLGLAERFDTIIDSAVVGIEKPNPAIFHLALRKAGIDASEALFVGDTYSTDIGGAQLAGLRGVLIDRVGAYSKVACPRISALSELGAVLEYFSS